MPSTPNRREIRCECAMVRTPVHSIQQGNPTTAPSIVSLCPPSFVEIDIGCHASVLAVPFLLTRRVNEDLHTAIDDLSLNSGGFESIGEEQPNRRRHRSVRFESRGSPLSSCENTSRRSVASSLNGFHSPSKDKENFPLPHLCLPKLHVSATSSRHNLGVKNLKRRAPPSSSDFCD
jgi:hypothetical protein